MSVYIDLLVLLNFLVDFCLLIGANRLAGYPVGLKRAALGALVGGIYGGVCVLPGLVFLSGTVWRIVFLLIVGGVGFGFRREAIRRCVLFTLLSLALGGVAAGLEGSGFWTLILSAAGIFLMCAWGLRGRLGAQYVPVEVVAGEHVHRFTALVDTGNTLKDPITGQDILVVSAALAQELAGLSQWELCNPVLAVERHTGLRLIPFHAVGVSGGLLVGKKFEKVTVGQKEGSCILAFAPNELGQGMPYEALTGGSL